jgi:hypothetical protein
MFRNIPYRLNFADTKDLSELPGEVVLSFKRLEEVFGPIRR